jgi:hypothetical protein
MTAKGVPTPIDATIRSAIDTYPNGLLGTLAAQSDPLGRGSPLVIKYIPAKFAMGYQTAKTTQLRISDTAGFTWGDGTYVSPLAFPISTAVFGRVGVVAKFDPAGWRVFDATTDQHQSYYLQWASRQPLFRRATLTALSPYSIGSCEICSGSLSISTAYCSLRTSLTRSTTIQATSG